MSIRHLNESDGAMDQDSIKADLTEWFKTRAGQDFQQYHSGRHYRCQNWLPRRTKNHGSDIVMLGMNELTDNNQYATGSDDLFPQDDLRYPLPRWENVVAHDRNGYLWSENRIHSSVSAEDLQSLVSTPRRCQSFLRAGKCSQNFQREFGMVKPGRPVPSKLQNQTNLLALNASIRLPGRRSRQRGLRGGS